MINQWKVKQPQTSTPVFWLVWATKLLLLNWFNAVRKLFVEVACHLLRYFSAWFTSEQEEAVPAIGCVFSGTRWWVLVLPVRASSNEALVPWRRPLAIYEKAGMDDWRRKPRRNWAGTVLIFQETTVTKHTLFCAMTQLKPHNQRKFPISHCLSFFWILRWQAVPRKQEQFHDTTANSAARLLGAANQSFLLDG